MKSLSMLDDFEVLENCSDFTIIRDNLSDVKTIMFLTLGQ